MHYRTVHGVIAGVLWLLLAGCDLPATDLRDSPGDGVAAVTPEPATATAPPGARFTVQVSGTVVNLRAGPSLEAPILAQVEQGDALAVTGISADHQWLQIVVSAEHRWIYADWTDITGDGRGALAVVDAQALGACPETGPSPSLRCDKAVLLAVRDALRGSNTEALHTWHSARALADFEGVGVDGQPLRVVALTVAWPTELRGVLPPQLGQLRQLQQLDLRGHWLHGALPPEIGQLRQLRRLDLSFNELQGGLPPELGQLTNLKFLDLAFNHLDGELPPELGRLTALEELSLAYNSLRSLPPELGQLTALHTLHLHNNRFSGPWPAELGRLPSLRELSLAHNWELTGPQPPALGPMHRVGPGWFRTHPLPKAGSPAQVAAGIHPNQTDPGAGLYLLQLTGERVTATFTATHPPGPQAVRAPLLVVPPPFRPPYAIQRTVEGPGGPTYGSPEPDLPTFPRFRLQVNPDGSVHYVGDTPDPGEDRQAYTLHTVWGTTPAANDQAVLEILDQTWFQAPVLSRTPPPVRRQSHHDEARFVPEDLFVTRRADGRVTALDMLNNITFMNHFIPPALGELTALQDLRISTQFSIFYPDRFGANLIGPIPPSLGQLTQLQTLVLGGNYLTGPIPPSLGQLTQLQTLNLGSNLLTGTLPPELGQLTQLQTLGLGGNLLTGTVPPELGQLARLLYLSLSSHDYDRVRFDLPARYTAALELPDTPLTGGLPASLGQLTRLRGLSLDRNQFSSLPPELGQLAQLRELDLSDNQLKTLPPELGQLTNLRTLYLSDNQLKTLPPELGQLTNLRTLAVRDNQLKTLPPELGQLTNLSVLYLGGNALTGCLPAAWQDRFSVTTRTSGEPQNLPYCPD